MYKVKGSKHFGYVFEVRDKAQIKLRLEEIRKEHHSARHHCYAFRLGPDQKEFRANDDGEPSNSAGKPILGQIQSFDLTDVLIVVVRYFGGTKLGVGGLIDAYRTAAKFAIENAGVVTKNVTFEYQMTFTYELMGEAMKVLKDMGLEMYDSNFDNTCSLKVLVTKAQENSFIQKLKDSEVEIEKTV